MILRPAERTAWDYRARIADVPPPPPGMPPPPPSGFAPAPKKRRNRGCIVGLVILGGLALVLVIGLAIAAVFVVRAADEAGVPGLLGGECAEFQAAYLTITFTGILGAGADEAQQEQLEQELGALEALAPSEIEDELMVVAGAFREAIRIGSGGQGLAGGAEPSAEQTRAAEAVLERPEVVEAQAEINRWVADNCA